MLRLTTLSNKNKRRTLRALYAHTQGYPYDAQLDPNFNRAAGALTGAAAITGATAAILPGLVAVKQAGEQVTAQYVAAANQRSFGLFANFVGGTMDELGTGTEVGVWRGAGSVYEVLAPAFSTTNLATETAAEVGTAATEVYMDVNATTAQLQANAAGVRGVSTTARALSYLSANAVIIELLV